MKLIDVVAGVIFDAQGRNILLALRKPEQHQGNRWEFPGGKMESGESQADALRRELLEEIDITVEQCQHRRTLEHQYSDKHVRLHFWDVTRFTGTPRGCEGQQLEWAAVSALGSYTFPDANQVIVDDLMVL